MSRSPTGEDKQTPGDDYLDAWLGLAQRIQQGNSFSGREPNSCFLNTAKTRFADVSAAVGFDLKDDGRTIALTDWDHDGDVDLWVANRTGPRVRYLRNDVPQSNHFLAMRLVGDPSLGCNRDAIGARVELFIKGDDNATVRRIQTLRAGDALLSQSSKWLHFGLGSAREIERLVVRWPGGNGTETFTGLKVDQRYVARQGTGSVEPDVNSPRDIKLASTPNVAPPVSERTRLRFVHAPLVQEIEYRDLDDKPMLFEAPFDGPVLLTFWASWCMPCIEELHELASHANEWQAKKLRIIALNVESLGSETPPGSAELRAVLDKAGFAGDAGIATAEIVAKFDQLQRDAIYRQRQLPLPSSFLMDHGGWLKVVYKGPIDLEQLRFDIDKLRTSEREARQLAVPFPGRWADTHFVTNPIAVSNTQLEQGDVSDAREYLERYLKEHPQPPPNRQDREATMARLRLADVHNQLGRVFQADGQSDNAAAAFRQALDYNPRLIPALLGLGTCLTASGDYDQAERLLTTAARLAPGNGTVTNGLGVLHLRQGKVTDAIGDFRQALRADDAGLPAANNLAWLLATHADERYRDGDEAVELARRVCQASQFRQPRALDTLAAALAETGRFDDAIQIVRRAMELSQTAQQPQLTDKLASRLALYEQGKPYRATDKD